MRRWRASAPRIACSERRGSTTSKRVPRPAALAIGFERTLSATLPRVPRTLTLARNLQARVQRAVIAGPRRSRALQVRGPARESWYGDRSVGGGGVLGVVSVGGGGVGAPVVAGPGSSPAGDTLAVQRYPTLTAPLWTLSNLTPRSNPTRKLYVCWAPAAKVPRLRGVIAPSEP